MIRKALALAVVAAACMGAAPKPAARAAKPAAASPSRALDNRDPASMIAVLSALGAEATVARRDGDAVFLAVTSATEVFSAQFAGCDAQGRGCQAVLFDRQGEEGAPTLAQLNAFNQTSVMCRLYQDRSGRPHVQYSALLFPKDGRDELVMHLNAWRGCIADFNAFLKDPAGFLAGAA
ncbi:YbjN domain-containing protein [Phenylobacterium sp. LjRoot219]|uniref:YbjN domain-containing protein n=1 Tax=Phenylobacterium sp. LjRoot219 TaxID=3342283 RepID=UPI003ED15713